MAQRPTKIRRNMMLKELDIKWLPNGNRMIFNIKFVDKSGKVRFFPLAVCRGLRYNMSIARQRGVQPCKENGDLLDHVYPVGIDNIIQYNGMEVIL